MHNSNDSNPNIDGCNHKLEHSRAAKHFNFFCLSLVMDPVLSQFGWTMFDAQVHLLVALLIVRVVHHLNIITVIIVKMSLWSVVSSIVSQYMIMIIFFTEFSYSRTSGPYATLSTCRYADSPSKFLSNIYNWLHVFKYMWVYSICNVIIVILFCDINMDKMNNRKELLYCYLIFFCLFFLYIIYNYSKYM